MVFKELKVDGTFGGNNEGYKFFQDLYEFNKTLPDDKKLKYLGVDIEHQTNLAIGYLWDIALRNDIYENVKELIENYNQETSNDELLAYLLYLLSAFANSVGTYFFSLRIEIASFLSCSVLLGELSIP